MDVFQQRKMANSLTDLIKKKIGALDPNYLLVAYAVVIKMFINV